MGRPTLRVPRLRTRQGRYYVVWYDAASGLTKKRSLGTAVADEAKKSFARFLLEDPEALQSQGPDALTVRRALADYLREHVKDKVADVERQRCAIDHLTAHFGDRPLRAIDIPASREYAAARRAGLIGGGKRRKDKTGSDSTIRRELNVLVAASNHARRWKRIDVLPSIELPAEEPRGDEEMPYFERTTVAAILAAAERQIGLCRAQLDADRGGKDEATAQAALDYAVELRHWIRLTYFFGSRGASVARLTAEQVKLFSRSVTLATPGKRKTKKRQPILPIFDEIVPDLAALLDAHPTGKLFKTVKFYRPFMRLCRALDLPEPHHPHMLRHSRATHLLQDGKDIWDVAALLGDTVATVQRTYGHHSPNELRRKLA